MAKKKTKLRERYEASGDKLDQEHQALFDGMDEAIATAAEAVQALASVANLPATALAAAVYELAEELGVMTELQALVKQLIRDADLRRMNEALQRPAATGGVDNQLRGVLVIDLT